MGRTKGLTLQPERDASTAMARRVAITATVDAGLGREAIRAAITKAVHDRRRRRPRPQVIWLWVYPAGADVDARINAGQFLAVAQWVHPRLSRVDRPLPLPGPAVDVAGDLAIGWRGDE